MVYEKREREGETKGQAASAPRFKSSLGYGVHHRIRGIKTGAQMQIKFHRVMPWVMAFGILVGIMGHRAENFLTLLRGGGLGLRYVVIK